MNIKKHMPRLMAFLLSFSMALGSVVPAYATDADIIITESALEEEDTQIKIEFEDADTGLYKPESKEPDDNLETVSRNDNIYTNSGTEIYAINNEGEQSDTRYETVEVNFNQASNYVVNIPKTITLGSDKKSSYPISVEGDIAVNKQICVVPVDEIPETEVFDFYMRDQIPGSTKADVVAEISQNKFYWNYEEAANGYEEMDNYIVADGLSAGQWKGTFQIEISMRTDPTHIHNYVGETTKEPSCTEPGEKVYTCDCGENYSEAIDPTGHHYENGECSDCGEKDPDYHEHSYTEAITKEPTCTEEGEKTLTCECGDSYTETIPATGHDYVDGECSECGEKDPDAHEHSYAETVTKLATCTEAGEKTLTCECGDTKTESIPATGHNYGQDDKCTDCGELNPNHEHSYTEAITKEPTCTEAGEKTLTCECGDTKTESISATGHNYVSGKCENCGEIDPDIHEHSYSESITKEPTCTEAGEKTLTCECGDTKTESIPATEHDYEINPKITSWVHVRGTDFIKETTGEKWTIGKSGTGIWSKNYTWEIEISEPIEYTIEYYTTNMWGPGSYTDVFEIILDGNTIVRTSSKVDNSYTTTLSAGKHILYASLYKESSIADVRASIYIPSITAEMTSTPTCTEDGSRELKCSRCGDIQSEIVVALGHDYVNYKCTRCGALDPTHNHSYSETITKESTCITDGEKKYSCICGDSHTEIISALGHDYVDSVCTKCGEVDPDHSHAYVDGLCTICGCTQGAGLYDENGVLLASWHDLTTEYGLDITADATASSTAATTATTMTYVLKNYSELSSGTKLIVDSSVTNIGRCAFSGSSLKEVQLPDGLETIEYSAFSGTALTHIEIPDSVTQIEGSAFYSCKSLTNAKLPKGDCDAGSGLFSNCTALKEITVPDGWTTIPTTMFNSCSGLETIYLSDTITSIESQAFIYCTSLKAIDLLNTVSIGKLAFGYCSSLETVSSTWGLTLIDESAFRKCTSLKSLYIPATCRVNGVVSGIGTTSAKTTSPFYDCLPTLELYLETTGSPVTSTGTANTTFNDYKGVYSASTRGTVVSRVVTHRGVTREEYEATLTN